MNITETVYLSYELFVNRLFRDTPLLQFFQLSFAWVTKIFWKCVLTLVNYVLIVFGDLAQILWLISSILLFVILFSLYSSIKPRYNFVGTKSNSERAKKELTNKQLNLETKIFTETLKSIILKENHPLHRILFDRISNKFKEESSRVSKESCLSLNTIDVQSVYRQLSWSSTQSDVESVQWLNQAFITFWPSIKTLLNKFVLNDLLKPKSKRLSLPKESKDLTKKEAKLSVLISSRRKLDLILKEKNSLLSKYREFINRSAIAIIVVLVKLGLIYIKQFVIDFIKYTLKTKSDKIVGPKLDLKGFLVERLNGKKLREQKRGFQSWGGFDLESARRKISELAAIRPKRKLKSAETTQKVDRVFFTGNGLNGPRSLARLREKRLKSASNLKRRHNYLQNKKDITFEQIKLGNSIPIIEGIKHIEELSNLFSDVEAVSRRLIPSDNCNTKFIIELSYKTDKEFCLLINSIPILNRISITKLNLNLRILLTLNHTVSELNRDLKIFQTPDDILWPIINHAQIALVDVPQLDWNLVRPPLLSSEKSRTANRSVGIIRDKSSLKHKIKHYLDPIAIINHTYFKYIVHSVVYLVLKWFQPFDIKIGDHLYIKSIC